MKKWCFLCRKIFPVKKIQKIFDKKNIGSRSRSRSRKVWSRSRMVRSRSRSCSRMMRSRSWSRSRMMRPRLHHCVEYYRLDTWMLSIYLTFICWCALHAWLTKIIFSISIHFFFFYSPDDDVLYMREPTTHSSTSPSELDAAYRLSPDEEEDEDEDQDYLDEEDVHWCRIGGDL